MSAHSKRTEFLDCGAHQARRSAQANLHIVFQNRIYFNKIPQLTTGLAKHRVLGKKRQIWINVGMKVDSHFLFRSASALWLHIKYTQNSASKTQGEVNEN